MSVETHIDGADLIVQRFGFWPPFADAEILALRFERGNHMEVIEHKRWNERIAESLEVTFFVFDARHAQVTPERKPTKAVIRFEPLTEFTMNGFNYQNPILCLDISRVSEKRFRVEWGGTAMHHEVSFVCERIRVLSVTPIAA